MICLVTVTKLHCEGVPSNQINWSITPPTITPDSWCTFALLFSSNLDGISVGNNGRSANIANPTEASAVPAAVYHDEIYPGVGWGGVPLSPVSPQEGRRPPVFQINTWILLTKWWLIVNFIASVSSRLVKIDLAGLGIRARDQNKHSSTEQKSFPMQWF